MPEGILCFISNLDKKSPGLGISSTCMKEINFEQKIIHHLILQSPFISDIGLLYGKMGIALFFFDYGRYKNCEVCIDIADKLLENIWENMYVGLSFNFDSGLSGIAWGIEYLIRKKIVAGDVNEVFEAVDNRIMCYDLRRMNSNAFMDKEIEGVLHYILIRISGSVKRQYILPFDDVYMKELVQYLMFLKRTNRLSVKCIELMNLFVNFIDEKQDVAYMLDLLPLIECDESNMKTNSIISFPLGLRNGICGLLYKQLFKL